MNPELIETAAAQFCGLSPTLLVWLGGTLLCAYRYEQAPTRYICLGTLLSVMVVCSVGLPFAQYMAISATRTGSLSYGGLSVASTVASLTATLFVSVIPPVAVVCIAVLTASPTTEAPE